MAVQMKVTKGPPPGFPPAGSGRACSLFCKAHPRNPGDLHERTGLIKANIVLVPMVRGSRYTLERLFQRGSYGMLGTFRQ
jgi:hypothetical protein